MLLCRAMSAPTQFTRDEAPISFARTSLALAVVLASHSVAGCSSPLATYPGPRRPAAKVALLHAPDMEIEAVDGHPAGFATSEFEVAPGAHVVVARIDGRRRNVRVSSDESLRFCFSAEAAHSYKIVPLLLLRQRSWYARVADETTNGWVPVQSLRPDTTACALEHPRPVFRLAWPIGRGGIGNKARDERAESFHLIKSQVEMVWNPIEEYARRNPGGPDLGMRQWTTVLHLRLHADGSLADVQTVVSSGAPILDEIAVSAVRQAQPYPAPAPDLVQQSGVVTIPLAFEIMAGGTRAEAPP